VGEIRRGERDLAHTLMEGAHQRNRAAINASPECS
jgi:hypothetical protein